MSSSTRSSEWRHAKLDELGSVGRGRSKHRPRNDPALHGGPYPFIQTGDISGCDIYITSYSQTYSELGLAQSKIWPAGTVCIVNAGENTGETGILTFSACFPDSVIAFTADPEKSDPRFINYSLRLLKPKWRSVTKGATQDNLSVEKLLSFPLLVPSLSTQQRIASILSAYDDLIENNTKRIKILEEMARSLYREWFVHFRFPGHEKVKMVNSALGKVPEGWRVIAASDAVDMNPRTAVRADLENPFVPMSSLSSDSMLIHDVETRAGNTGAKFKNGDTLFARITPCLENGKTGFVQFLPNAQSVACGSTEFIVLREKLLRAEMIYLLARLDSFRDHAIKSMTGATGRQRVQEKCFDTYLLAVPTSDVADRFTRIVRPMFTAVHTMAERMRNLRQTRDLLLPRLISGEIDVSQVKAPG